MLFLPVKIWQTVTNKLLKNISYNSVFEFFIQSTLILPNHSDFKTGGSSFKQLISITHTMYKEFDDCYEERGVFLDISKAFGKVWHLDLHCKLRQNGISGKLLNTLAEFLDNKNPTSNIKRSIFFMSQGWSWSSPIINSWATIELKEHCFFNSIRTCVWVCVWETCSGFW